MTTEPSTITREDLAALLDAGGICTADGGTQLIDVRPARLFEAAHIPGAINLPFETLGSATADTLTAAGLDPARPTVIYGRKEEAGRKAADTLSGLGCEGRVLLGGMNEWLREQQPCEPPVKGWACGVCSYGYKVHRGDEHSGAEPGTLFEELPETWRCPWCGALKDRFFKETWT